MKMIKIFISVCILPCMLTASQGVIKVSAPIVNLEPVLDTVPIVDSAGIEKSVDAISDDPFYYAEKVTGFSAEVLLGLAAIESNFNILAVGDDGASHGMFQLHSRWYESRAKKWGDFDPNDPFESAVIAGRIMQDNLSAFGGNLRQAIAAYKQGVSGVRKHGIIEEYVDAVLSWYKIDEKVSSFYAFIGIKDTEGMQNGRQGDRTQGTRELLDSASVQISWRGRGGFPKERGEDRGLAWTQAQ